jgi:hypothetical protein
MVKDKKKPNYILYFYSKDKEKKIEFDDFCEAADALGEIRKNPEKFEFETITLGAFQPDEMFLPVITYKLIKNFEIVIPNLES